MFIDSVPKTFDFFSPNSNRCSTSLICCQVIINGKVDHVPQDSVGRCSSPSSRP